MRLEVKNMKKKAKMDTVCYYVIVLTYSSWKKEHK